MSAPRVLLSLRSLNGPSLATRDRLLEVGARYREPESLAVTLAKAIAAPVDGVFTCVTPALRAAIAELVTEVPLHVIVPAVSEYERQELGAGIERVIEASRARARGTARLAAAWAGLWRPAMFGRGDYAWRLPVLIASELAGLERRAVRGIVLDAWFTDLALAAGNRKMFDAFVRYVRRLGMSAGLETRNLGTLLARLREWEVQPDYVAGPVNPSGLAMKPSPEELLAEMRRGFVPVVARELCAGGVDALDAAAEYAIEQGAYGLAPDLTEMDDVGAELKALGREHATR